MDREITQEDFIRYEQVREEGHYNMLDSRARLRTGLTTNRYLNILTHYNQYAEKWNS